jgi:hypothetical protein
MRAALLAAIAASALLGVSGARPAATDAIAHYCEPDSAIPRDLCYAIVRKRTTQTHYFSLSMGEPYFARVRLCVQPPGETRTCRSFPVRQFGIYGPRWGVNRSWERNYPVRGPGRYRVTWSEDGNRLGPSLKFTYPGPPSYCSETGDVCYGIFKEAGAYRFKLTLAAKYFPRYRICVRRMGLGGTCKSFPVKKAGAHWGGTVSWFKNFPHVPARYRVAWLQGTHRIGPPLHFTLPPTA